MTTTQVVETSVTVNNNSPIQDYVHLNDQIQPTYKDFSCEGIGDFFTRSRDLLG